MLSLCQAVRLKLNDKLKPKTQEFTRQSGPPFSLRFGLLGLILAKPFQTFFETPMSASVLTTLANYLAGEFENQAQAVADPTWYVHLRLWQVPVPSLSDEHTYTLFLEQASVVSQVAPYRQRILQLTAQLTAQQPAAGLLQGQYFALAQPLKFRGAGTQPELLANLSAADLVPLSNSEALIQYQSTSSISSGEPAYRFQAALPEGRLCSFEYDGQRRYVYLGFEIAPKDKSIELLTYDKGVDPETGRGLWGALMGPFCMVKQKSFDWPAVS
jgi:hypothetical protein